jgi:hypothetical protein
MSTKVATTEADEAKQELVEVIANLGKGPRDPDAMRKAANHMDRMREATFKRVELLDVAVPFIRELRDR